MAFQSSSSFRPAPGQTSGSTQPPQAGPQGSAPMSGIGAPSMSPMGSSGLSQGAPVGSAGGRFTGSAGMSPLMSQLMQRAQSGAGGTMPATSPSPLASFRMPMPYFNRGGITGGMGMPSAPQLGGSQPPASPQLPQLPGRLDPSQFQTFMNDPNRMKML